MIETKQGEEELARVRVVEEGIVEGAAWGISCRRSLALRSYASKTSYLRLDRFKNAAAKKMHTIEILKGSEHVYSPCAGRKMSTS